MGRAGCYVGLACFILLMITLGSAIGQDWPTYRHDGARSGVTSEEIKVPLHLGWIFKPIHAPKPAWPPPAEELPRMHFDGAYHVAVSDGTVYFGSSVEDKVYAVDAETGEIRWTFFTEGPVRFAPTIWKDKLYFGSDDGYVYCLKAKGGKLLWRYRAGPSDERVIGNGRMISLWPVRTSVLVEDGVVYFGAGVFPYEGIYICALNADDGTVIWKNDTMGDHAHELSYGGISPQSYLVLSENVLYVPSGRAMPAAFDRKSGRFLYYCPPGGKEGGTWALVERGELIAGVERSGTPAKVAYDEKTGKRKGDVYAWFPGIDMVVTPDVSYTLSEDGIHAIARAAYPHISEKLSAIRAERQKLAGMISDMRKKLLEVDEIFGREINDQIDAMMRRIDELAEEEERNLKSIACKWQYFRKNLCSLILVGDVVFAGGDRMVVAVNARTGREIWSGEINGRAYGLAASDGRLFVSTDKGHIYCFGEGKIARARVIKPEIVPSPYPEDELAPVYETAAERIVSETGVRKGYCLVLGCGIGRLAYELARRTELKIIGIEGAPKKAEVMKGKGSLDGWVARRNLEAAGLYGSRIVIGRWDLSDLPDCFANLIVSDELITSGRIDGIRFPPEEVFRVLRPYGGVIYLGQPSSESVRSLDLERLLGWLRGSGMPEPDVIRQDGIWVKMVRGRLEGAGSWTHLYANPQNTACSGDQLVRAPLGVLWFGEPGPKGMVERHARAAGPISINGRLFVQGEETIWAYDAYNGAPLWRREIPGAVRVRVDVDGGNLAATEEALYVAAKDKCYRLAPDTGEIVRIYEIPRSPGGDRRRWGYIACVGDKLFGSTAVPLRMEYAALWGEFVREDGTWKDADEISPEYRTSYEYFISRYPVPDEKARSAFHRSGYLWHPIANFPAWGSQSSPKGAVTERMMVSDSVFAMDADTGKLLWVHRGERIAHITIAIGDGMIFFAESHITQPQSEEALRERKELVEKGIYEESVEAELAPEDRDVRLVVALDAETGRRIWAKPIDLTGCGGDKMGTAYHEGILLFYGNFSNHDSGLFREGSLKWRRITALSAKTGEVLWSRPLNYLRRPLVVGDTIIIEPRACDLYTGRIKTRIHPISGERVPWEFLRPGHSCGITSASSNAIFYRSYCTAIYDLAEDRGLTLFGAIRPGCWLNLIAASGLLLFPEASSGCTCSFPIRCTVVLKHKDSGRRPRDWTVFITHGPMTPVKHFAINLGAPGDMKDDEGTLWFGYPRPRTWYGVKFNLNEKLLEGMGYFCRDFRGVRVEGTDRPWLFTSGCLGFVRCEVPLMDESQKENPALYTVRLGFAALSGDSVGQRVFDVKLQGNTVLKDFDILRETGAPNKALIKEFKVEVKGSLTIELVPDTLNLTMAQAPIINFIEIIKTTERR
jgi:outer membrane protein assembly factor BamB